jgi:hypothetical protein
MQLELTEAQRAELLELVEAALGETATEIHHAMDHAYRDKLRTRRAILTELLQQLRGGVAAAR